MKPSMIEVESSNIDAIGYMHGDLYVRFKAGAVYRHKNTPHALFVAMQRADSAGKFYHGRIKGKFTSEKFDMEAARPIVQDSEGKPHPMEGQTQGVEENPRKAGDIYDAEGNPIITGTKEQLKESADNANAPDDSGEAKTNPVESENSDETEDNGSSDEEEKASPDESGEVPSGDSTGPDETKEPATA